MDGRGGVGSGVEKGGEGRGGEGRGRDGGCIIGSVQDNGGTRVTRSEQNISILKYTGVNQFKYTKVY